MEEKHNKRGRAGIASESDWPIMQGIGGDLESTG
jgi:hypothetical protein